MNVINNSVDDFFDEFTDTVVFRSAKKTFDPLRKKFDGSDSAFDEAMASAISTLQMGISMMATQYVMNTLLPNIASRGVILYAYITSAKMVRGVASKLTGVKHFKSLARFAKVFTDGQRERAMKAQAAMDLVNHVDNQRLQKMKIANDSRRTLESMSLNTSTQNGGKSLVLFTEKTKTGTWKKTAQDKKIYEKATGTKLKGTGVSWGKLAAELNNYSEFATSAEEKIINLAQVQFDDMASRGVSRVQ